MASAHVLDGDGVRSVEVQEDGDVRRVELGVVDGEAVVVFDGLYLGATSGSAIELRWTTDL